jgi:hypothetical protein
MIEPSIAMSSNERIVTDQIIRIYYTAKSNFMILRLKSKTDNLLSIKIHAHSDKEVQRVTSTF